MEGKWIDRNIIEMAEWGALFQSRGYAVLLNDSDHPVAMAQFIRSDGTEDDHCELTKKRQKVMRNLVKFPGRTRDIDGRPYIHFEDYCNWPSRKLKGNLPDIEKGIVNASWNAWINAQCGEGISTLAGVPITLLRCYIEGYPYYTCPNGAGDHLCRRKQLIDSLQTPHSRDNPEEELIQDFKDTIAGLLIEVHSFRDVITAVSQHYFDGHQLLFPDLEKVLAEIINGAEDLVEIFNDIIDEGIEQYVRMDTEDIRQSTSVRTSQQITYLVDMAKAEALENMGEKQAARTLTGRYL